MKDLEKEKRRQEDRKAKLIELLRRFPFGTIGDHADYMIEQGVEIPVHCAECKFWRDAILDGELKCCTIGYYMTKGSDYCSFGKRSDEE